MFTPKTEQTAPRSAACGPPVPAMPPCIPPLGQVSAMKKKFVRKYTGPSRAKRLRQKLPLLNYSPLPPSISSASMQQHFCAAYSLCPYPKVMTKPLSR